MRKIALLLLVTIALCSCGNSAKKKEIDSLLNSKEAAMNYKRQLETELKTSGDNNEIDEYNSAIIGSPVTKGQLRQNQINSQNRTIEELDLAIERAKNK